MTLDGTLLRLDDIQRPCGPCGTVTGQRQYDNGRQRIFVCIGCAMISTAAVDRKPDQELG